MKRVAVVGLLVGLVVSTAWVPAGPAPGASATLVAGLVLLVGHAAGSLLSAVGLPRITGYLCSGLLLGPQVSAVIAVPVLAELHFLNELAVAFIALAAGAELRLVELRHRLRVIGTLGATIAVLVAPSVALLMFACRGMLAFTDGMTPVQALTVCCLFGALGIARSPSSALAVIREARARGAFTDTALSVTVALDAVAIVGFAVALSLCQASLTGAGVDFAFLITVSMELGAGIVTGVLIGTALAFYIARAPGNLALLLLGTALVVTQIAHETAAYVRETHDLPLQLEPLLICVSAGFTVRNFSAGGRQFADAVESVSLPVFVLFFTLTGASLNVEALWQSWPAALLVVAVGMTCMVGASWLGARLAGEGSRSRLYGLTLFTQAGVSLGLTMEVVRRFPDWGGAFATVVVAAISVNQLIGPVAMKFALQRSGEAAAPAQRADG